MQRRGIGAKKKFSLNFPYGIFFSEKQSFTFPNIFAYKIITKVKQSYYFIIITQQSDSLLCTVRQELLSPVQVSVPVLCCI